ncbi:MAG: lipoyl synthase [Candidatus Omnitrophica bacterium]|nr:lipoyl synthase [Candidatus Omnitrophota bacterium]
MNLLIANHYAKGKHKRFPEWLFAPRAHNSQEACRIQAFLKDHSIHTVCERANCPNRRDCYSRRSMTFLILGDRCTRQCAFCSVSKEAPGPVNPEEPAKIAYLVACLNISYIIITSVTRDDLSDGGAAHFARCIQVVREKNGDLPIEVLVPDFAGSLQALCLVVESNPAVIGHNIETVRRRYSLMRRGADYQRSLLLLKEVKRIHPGLITKSGIMVGLGETAEEVIETLNDLRAASVDIVTIGQYLRSHHDAADVSEFVPPEQFGYYRQKAEKIGFSVVNAGPFIRSSYMAKEAYLVATAKKTIG